MWVAVLIVGFGSVWAEAIAADLSHPPLTLPLLDRRIAAPIRQGGAAVIDLKGFSIDLRPNELRPESSSASGKVVTSEQFYQQLQKALNGPRPLGLDLSGALIQGDFDLARLSLRLPAYGSVTLPALDEFNQTFQPARPSVGALGRSLLIGPLLTQSQRPQLGTLAFQGPLWLSQTCFDGVFKAADVYLLGPVESDLAIFTRMADWHGAKFAQSANFSEAQFQQESSFRSALFGSRARFNQARFTGASSWQGVTFQESTSFAQSDFRGGNFSRAHWRTNADFDQAVFHEAISFQKGQFDQALFLTDAQFEAAANFRQAQFQAPLSLRGARILNQLDFGDALFASGVTINVADLDFNAGEAKILGTPGQIGRVFSVPALASNETVLRNLVRNFRLLEQVSDANQVEYTTERLRLSQIRRHVFGVSLNRAGPQQWAKLGLSAAQVAAVMGRDRPFVSRADLLAVDEIDLATYLQVRDRVTVQSTSWLNRLGWLGRWLLLSSLLLLSGYGTNVGLIFSVGLVAATLFGLMFWGVDRYRRRLPTPIEPGPFEAAAMVVGGGLGLLIAVSGLSQFSDFPFKTLVAVGVLVLPVPLMMIARLYQQGRYHDLMGSSYFVKNGALRKLQILIARLPIVPQWPFYRDRYLPLLIDRRWSWLNYYDFSFNNWFKFGFNDIRLRDQAVPGLVSALVWYQWGLGIAYVVLLLWTLSRTIPGLNLLLYF